MIPERNGYYWAKCDGEWFIVLVYHSVHGGPPGVAFMGGDQDARDDSWCEQWGERIPGPTAPDYGKIIHLPPSISTVSTGELEALRDIARHARHLLIDDPDSEPGSGIATLNVDAIRGIESAIARLRASPPDPEPDGIRRYS